MPMVTYFDAKTLVQTKDKDILELMEECKSNGVEFLCEERSYVIGHLWWKKTKTIYCLYHPVGGYEHQIINFCQEHEWSINTFVAKSYLINYMYGVLTGLAK